jgi:hypothetical protein
MKILWEAMQDSEQHTHMEASLEAMWDSEQEQRYIIRNYRKIINDSLEPMWNSFSKTSGLYIHVEEFVVEAADEAEAEAAPGKMERNKT